MNESNHSSTVCMISCIGRVTYTRNRVILNTLADFGYEIVAIAPADVESSEDVSSITLYPLPLPDANFWYDAGFANTIRAIWQRLNNVFVLFRKVGEVKPDILFCSEPDAWLVAVLSKKRYGCKVLVDLQEVYDDRALAFPRPLQGIVRAALRQLMRILSQYTDEIIHVSLERQQAYKYLSKPGVIIGSYPELKSFPLPETVKAGAQSDIITAIHVGALRPTYASEQLLEAMQIVADTAPEIRFVVLGGISGTLKNAEIVESLTVRGVLEFIQQVPFTEVVDRLRSSDIGINLVLPVDTAHRLAAPQKLYEYFAAVLPVVVADVPTLRRVVTEQKCGVIVDGASPQSIADGIVSLASNQKMRTQMGSNARQAAENIYNWEMQVYKLRQVMEKLG